MTMLIYFVLVILALAILAVLKSKQTEKSDGLSFEQRESLFTPAERSFLGVLDQVLDERYRVFGKVRFDDLVKPAKGQSSSRRTTAQNKTRMKHADFVVCRAADLAVFGVIELDDKSHGRKDRVARDKFVEQVCASAKLPLVRFEAQKGYRLEEVRARLAAAFSLVEEKPEPTANKEESVAERAEPIVEVAIEEVEPVCLKCSSQMVKRQAKNGPNAGKWFWACSTFPTCRGMAEII